MFFYRIKTFRSVVLKNAIAFSRFLSFFCIFPVTVVNLVFLINLGLLKLLDCFSYGNHVT